MAQPVTKVPVETTNTYEQGKGADAAPERKVGPAYSGGSLQSNPTANGKISR